MNKTKLSIFGVATAIAASLVASVTFAANCPIKIGGLAPLSAPGAVGGGEAMRDAMMSVAGTLDLEPIKGSLVQKLKSGEVGKNGGIQSLRSFSHRSVYLPIVRNYVPEFLQVFDFAEPASVIGRRDITTVSTQALFMLNDSFVIEQSDATAKRLFNDERLNDQEERISGAYLLTFGRTPSGSELSLFRKYLGEAVKNGQSPESALSGYIQALFASAEFRYAL